MVQVLRGRGDTMFRKLFAFCAAALLLAACGESRPPTAEGPMRSAAAGATYTVYFESGSIALNASSAATLDKVLAAWRSGGVSKITATGHTDTVGKLEANMTLSQRRADVVKTALINRGIPGGSIVMSGLGEQDLVVQTADNVAEQNNRCVVITLK